jgi:hypothetical protein
MGTPEVCNQHHITMPKILSILGLLLLLLSPTGAAELVGQPSVQATETTAAVRWTTDVDCGSTVRFGTDEKNLIRKKEGSGVAKNHELALYGLQPGTKYFFEVGTAKKALGRSSFQTGGKSSSGSAESTPAAEPTKEPKPLLKRLFSFLDDDKAEKPATPAPDAKPATKPKDTAAKKPAATAPAPALEAPPTRNTWGSLPSLEDHYVRHGKDFNCKSADEYAAKAWLFLQRAMDEGLPVKQDEEGTLRVWDPKSRSFAAYNSNLTTKTYFRPNSADYFDRQPGKKVKLVRKKS